MESTQMTRLYGKIYSSQEKEEVKAGHTAVELTDGCACKLKEWYLLWESSYSCRAITKFNHMDSQQCSKTSFSKETP